jgi:hypothetical protein
MKPMCLARLVHVIVSLLLIFPWTVIGTANLSYATLFDFNYGMEEAGKFCSSQEWTLVQTVIANATLMAPSTDPNQTATVPPGRIRGRQRDLTERERHHAQHRQLKNCRNCGRYCAMLGFGCVVQGRRRLEGSDRGEMTDIASQEENPSRRRLSTPCDQNITAVTAALELIRPSLSTECQDLVFAPRNISCVQTTTDCFVESFTLWNARYDTVMIHNFNGHSICKRSYVSIEAKTNYYLGSVRFVVTGGPTALNTTDTLSPYYIMGNDPYNIWGTYFGVGNYTLMAISEDGNRFSKSINFTSRQC